MQVVNERIFYEHVEGCKQKQTKEGGVVFWGREEVQYC